MYGTLKDELLNEYKNTISLDLLNRMTYNMITSSMKVGTGDYLAGYDQNNTKYYAPTENFAEHVRKELKLSTEPNKTDKPKTNKSSLSGSEKVIATIGIVVFILMLIIIILAILH